MNNSHTTIENHDLREIVARLQTAILNRENELKDELKDNAINFLLFAQKKEITVQNIEEIYNEYLQINKN